VQRRPRAGTFAQAMKLPDADQIKARLRPVVRPQSKLGRTTLWFGVLAGAAEILQLIVRPAPGTMLSGWAQFLSFVFFIFLLLLGLRWVRQRLMWRLRNRLIVTYVFIGVIPILLLVSMGLLAGYLFAGQFATYVALSDLQNELDHLKAANDTLTAQFRSLTRADHLTPELAAEIASASEENFRQRTVTVLDSDKGYVISPGGRIESTQVKLPEAVKGDFSSFTMDNGYLYLRAVKHVEAGSRHLIVISNVPVNSGLLQRSAALVGAIYLYPPKRESPKSKGGKAAEPRKQRPDDSLSIDLGNSHSTVTLAGQDLDESSQNIEAGKVPPPVNRFDREVSFWTLFDATNWNTGERETGAVMVSTRPSLLYNVLFGRLGEKAGIFVQALAFIAIFFGFIELIALFIGVRLTRSMTKSVGELYTATESVNRGDLTHRIKVESRDQMAALEQSFNSMTTSLARLMAEQKDKQRMENELAIAQEVQELLFPRESCDLPTLEVHGVCRPARTVSGDYYDFIRLPDDRMVLAVGDISGKGISAALLMATVHAFVRAYSLEPELTQAPMLMAGAASGGQAGELYYRDISSRDEECTPGRLMTTLNYQLFRATPPEKYATMFLGCYDPDSRSLVYSNGGHLPPILLSQDQTVVRLGASGTVVGLFDGVGYGESRVPMRPGDIFAAFSDGVTEPENEFGEFGEDRLIELIQLHRDQPLARISEVVTTAVADWIGGAEQPDDVTLVLARAR
jgi:sigma-B regulation protein RsbU (phosphoserine phosphatase)